LWYQVSVCHKSGRDRIPATEVKGKKKEREEKELSGEKLERR
jgi:hypothetical protein